MGDGFLEYYNSNYGIIVTRVEDKTIAWLGK